MRLDLRTNISYEDIIGTASKQYRVDPNLIKAVIHVESGWDPKATRAEPQINDKSYGLMQVLLNTGRSVSGNDSLTASQLIQPSVNILIGTKYLGELRSKYKKLDDAIASYNAGSPIKKAGKYINQSYVNSVKRWLNFYKYGGSTLITTIPIITILGMSYFMIRKT